MIKLNTLIIDDELNGRNNLHYLLKSYCPEIEVVGKCGKPNEAKLMIYDLKPDVVFLDINMPKVNGFELLDSLIYKDFMLVFVTAHSEHGIQAVKANAVDYLLKPVSIKELQQTVKKLVELKLKITTDKERYDKGLSLLKDKKYDLALIEFQKVDSLNKNYKGALSKINYINGLISYNSNKFEESLIYFKLVDPSDELSPDVKIMIDNFKKNSVIVYNTGVKFLKEKSYNSALKEFQKINSKDANYSKAQNKMNYIRALEYINQDNYESAEEFLTGYDASDEFYDEVKILQDKVKSFKDNQANKEYARILLNLANNIQDQLDHPPDNYPDFIQQLVWLRSSVNSSVNNAKKIDNDLKNLKESIIKWVNNYIKRSENGYEYRKQINRSYGYVNDNLVQNNFGDEIQKNREIGNKLHNQVIKEINNIKSKYEIN
ncbi:MAG TPA: response regulator [Ignavibacteria bacterium]